MKANHAQSVKFLLCAFLLAGLSTAHSQEFSAELNPFEIEYEVGNNLINAGSAKLSLIKQGDEWVYSLTTKPSGIFKLTGKGKIQEVAVINVSNERSLRPKRYTYRQDSEDKRSVDAWFNWDDNQLRFQRRGEETIEQINDPILDRLSVTLTIMEQLRQGFERAELQVFDNGRIKTVVFQNEGQVNMKTKLGRVDTVKVRSFNRDGVRKRETITWFAPDFDFIPVQIEQHKKGKLVARLSLSKLKNSF